MRIEEIARVCHEASRAHQNVIGGDPLPCWEEASDNQRVAANSAVQFILNNPDAPIDEWMPTALRSIGAVIIAIVRSLRRHIVIDTPRRSGMSEPLMPAFDKKPLHPGRLTAQQAEGLRRILRGPEYWCAGGRAGGAIARMFDRMADDGLCTKAPHRITKPGRAALAAYDKRARR